MKNILILLLTVMPFLAQSQASTSKKQVASVLNSWHKAAADADFDTYFSLMAKNAVFIGTDAQERWSKKAFMAYAKPHFNQGKAWSFSLLKRHIYITKSKTLAWFDELLDTHMGVCRGSGVLQKAPSGWKIQQYVLSITIPNAQVDAVKTLKQTTEAHKHP